MNKKFAVAFFYFATAFFNFASAFSKNATILYF